ncbi:hypothetical protein [Hymenobacter daeguensis]
MNSTQAKHALGKSRRSEISLPIMPAYAGCLLILVLFFLFRYGTQMTEMGLVPNSHLPITQTIQCGPEPIYAVISIDRNNNLSFELPSNEIQTAAIQNVVAKHGIAFRTSESTELKSLPFLAVAVEQLPQLLSLPYNRRNQLAELAKFKPLCDSQLIECILAARDYAQCAYQRSIVISFRCDTEMKTGRMMHLVDALQANGFSRFEYQNQIW